MKGKEKSTKSLERKVIDSSQIPTSPSAFGEEEGGRSSVSSSSPPLWTATYWSIVASLSFLCTGLVRSYTSPALVSIQSERGNDSLAIFSPTLSTSSRNDLISWFASFPPLASFLGCALSGPSLDLLGRRQTLFILSVPSLVGWILICNASSLTSLLLGRALTGFASGLSTATAPLYISEVCQSSPDENSNRKKRGWLGLIPGIMMSTGILMGLLLANQFQHWRKLAEIISLFPFMLAVLSLTIPESASWLQSRKRKEVDELKIDLEMDDVVAHPEPQQRTPTKSNLSEKSNLIPKTPNSFLRLTLPIGFLMILQQFSGGNVLIFYLSEVLLISPDHGPLLNPSTIHEASLIIGFVQFIGFLLAIPLIDHGRVGHRTLLITSSVLMSLAHLILGFHFYHFHSPDERHNLNDSWSSTMTIRVCLLSALFSFYSIGLGPIPFLFIQIFAGNSEEADERKRNKVKSYLSSIASLVNHLALFSVVKGFPYLFHMGCYGPPITFWMFSGVCWTAVLFTFYFVPSSQTCK